MFLSLRNLLSLDVHLFIETLLLACAVEIKISPYLFIVLKYK